MKKRPLMVVFEGPECTGKTTVVARLMDELSCTANKRVRTPDRYTLLATVMNDIDSQLRRTRWGSGESLVVFDRWQLVSDILYEKYCYEKESILEPLYPCLSEACLEANILIVYMTIDKQEMLNRFEVRGDRLRNIYEASMIWDAYGKFFSKEGLGSMLPVHRLDVSGLDQEQTYRAVLEIIKYHGGEV